jgi:hypothetical protein
LLPLLTASISGLQTASASLEVEEREASQSGQTDVGSQGVMVGHLFHLSVLILALIKNARTWKGEFGRVAYHVYIRGEVPFARPRAKPARPCPYRRLAITPPRHPGPCLVLSPRAIRTDAPAVTYLRTLRTARLDTHRSRRPRIHLATAVRRAN